MNRNQLDRLIVSGGIRLDRRAPMVYSRHRFTVMFIITLLALLITIVLGLRGII